MNWVAELISKIELYNGKLTALINGNEVTVIISNELKLFLKENQNLLIRIGKDSFKNFLLLLSEQKEEEAFMVLIRQMSAQEIIERMKMNADSLKKFNDDMDKFFCQLKKMLLNAAEKLALKLILPLIF